MNKQKYVKGRSMDLFAVFQRYFFNNEYMHFGYWLPEDTFNFANLLTAQQRYTDKLFAMIPNDVKCILDVGCGTGKMAAELLAKGYQVDVVCPPSIMGDIANKRLSDRANMYPSRFEEFSCDKKYDMIFFSESFQFIKLDHVLQQCQHYSNRYVLIADVFKEPCEGKPRIGGGHARQDFEQEYQKLGFTKIADDDVTEFIAPNFDLERDALDNFVRPMCDVIKRMSESSFWLRMGLFLKRKKLAKLQQKYMDNPRNGDTFKQCKSYRMILLTIPKNSVKPFQKAGRFVAAG